MKPLIRKIGTIDCGLVETTPVVFQVRLLRFEYVRENYWDNTTGASFFRFVDHETGEAGRPFGHGLHLGNVLVDGDTMYVSAVNAWDGERIRVLASHDLVFWDSWTALELPGHGMFNTSLCKAGGLYVLMFEVGKPAEVAGVPFTARFATSPDMRYFSLTPPECTYAKDRYTAPHALRHLDGWYYNFYLEDLGGSYVQCVVRSRDLILWEPSPMNPVLEASPEDRFVANPNLTPTQREHVRDAVNCNNSDIDFCEHGGEVVINYSWGNQQGVEFLAEARFDGSLAEFLTGWFP